MIETAYFPSGGKFVLALKILPFLVSILNMFHVPEETDISREIVSEVELDIDAFLLLVYMKNFCRVYF
jgi:hypothetical protein